MSLRSGAIEMAGEVTGYIIIEAAKSFKHSIDQRRASYAAAASTREQTILENDSSGDSGFDAVNDGAEIVLLRPQTS